MEADPALCLPVLCAALPPHYAIIYSACQRWQGWLLFFCNCLHGNFPWICNLSNTQICAVSSPKDTIADGKSNTEIAENTTIESEPISKEDSQSFDDTALTDGVYEGKAYGYDGAVKATVTIKDGKITDISCSSAESDLWYLQLKWYQKSCA